MLRLRLFDTEPDADPVPWTTVAPIVATLFLNFYFLYVQSSVLSVSCALPLYGLILAAEAIVVSALFFLGPALACQKAGRPLFGLIEDSLGPIGAWCVRICSVAFLIAWLSSLVNLPELFFWRWSGVRLFGIAVAVLLVLFATGLQNLKTNAKLAFLTDKLAIAVLVAALIRVHDGWPAMLRSPEFGGLVGIQACLHQITLLIFLTAPLGLSAADFGYRMPGRKQVVLVGALGAAIPLFGTLLLLSVLDMATYASGFYQPSLNANIGMALFSKVSRSALPGRELIASITIFGAIRFGARALATTIQSTGLRRRSMWIVLVVLIGLIAWCSLLPYNEYPRFVFAYSGTGLILVSAEITVRVKRKWVAAAAILAGLIVVFCMRVWSFNQEGDALSGPWMLPSYFTTLAVGYLGTKLTKTSVA